MDFRVIAIGDICAQPGLNTIRRRLWQLRRDTKADFVIANGENAAGVGITPDQAHEIFHAGVDVITLGNHALKRREIADFLEDNQCILRPANFSSQVPGRGMGFYDTPYGRICVFNLVGRCDMTFGPDSPFSMADTILKEAVGQAKFILCDFHAQATSEKYAMAYHLDGRASVLFGTHTHVQTADEHIFPNGLGYITDLGMTGPMDTVIGVTPEKSLAYFQGDMLVRFDSPLAGPACLCGALFTLNRESGKCISVERIRLEQG